MSLPAYAQIADPELIGRNQPHAVEMIGRLKPGVSLAHAASARQDAF
ncbi:hypothetical protein BH18ACI5_BH18ACI5_20320 [soil metagenome]